MARAPAYAGKELTISGKKFFSALKSLFSASPYMQGSQLATPAIWRRKSKARVSAALTAHLIDMVFYCDTIAKTPRG